MRVLIDVRLIEKGDRRGRTHFLVPSQWLVHNVQRARNQNRSQSDQSFQFVRPPVNLTARGWPSEWCAILVCVCGQSDWPPSPIDWLGPRVQTARFAHCCLDCPPLLGGFPGLCLWLHCVWGLLRSVSQTNITSVHVRNLLKAIIVQMPLLKCQPTPIELAFNVELKVQFKNHLTNNSLSKCTVKRLMQAMELGKIVCGRILRHLPPI